MKCGALCLSFLLASFSAHAQTGEIAQLIEMQGQTTVLPSGSTFTMPANTTVGGANAIPMFAECPLNTSMKGIRLTLGGTCSGQCNPDGRPVSTFVITCGK